MPMYYAGLRWHPHVVARGKPQLYKTFRGANRRAGDGGRVLVIDLEAMLVVTDDVHLDDRQIPEEEFAERQFGLWGEAVKRLSERST